LRMHMHCSAAHVCAAVDHTCPLCGTFSCCFLSPCGLCKKAVKCKTAPLCFFEAMLCRLDGFASETSCAGVAAAMQAVFEGGDYCHKAPPRSLRVRIECGTEEKAWDASEPEVCSYAVHASTPAACKSDR
jgi:hypothetical protein